MKKPTTKKRSRTNWARIDALKDSEIDFSDIPELGKAFFTRAVLRLPEPKTAVTIQSDRQVLIGSRLRALVTRRGSMPSSGPTWKRTKDEVRAWRA